MLEQDCIHLVEAPRMKAAHQRDPRHVFLGEDWGGMPLEVMAIELEDETLLVIHAMPLRDRYRFAYEEANRCRK